MLPIPKKLYRKGVGIVVQNAQGLIGVGKRADAPLDTNYWQMPQGGIDEGEDPEVAILRELWEETGITSVTITKKTEQWLCYDFPPEVQKTAPYNGAFSGQQQLWFWGDFYGDDSEVNLNVTGHQEFVAWQWVSRAFVLDHVVPFKKAFYEEIFRLLETRKGSL